MRSRISLIVVLAAVPAFLGSCRHEEPYSKPLTPVRLQTVEQRSDSTGTRYSANIKPFALVELAFRFGGYIEDIHRVQGADGTQRLAQEGDWVTRGTVLVRLREADYASKVAGARSQLAASRSAAEGARAQLQEAQAGLVNATSEFDRATKLYATQSLTKADLDRAKAGHDSIQAKVEAAKAQISVYEAQMNGAKSQLDEAELALRDSELKAPFDGVVLKRLVEMGGLVGPGIPVFVLADTMVVKASFGVPDSVVESLKPGDSLTVGTEAIPDKEFPGRISSISPSADPKSRVFEVEVKVSNPRRELKVGMIASVSVGKLKSPEATLLLPLSAIVPSKANPGGYAVWVLEDQQGKKIARLRNVKLGEAVRNMVAVTEGVRAGERIIVAGETLLVEGEEVQVMP